MEGIGHTGLGPPLQELGIGKEVPLPIIFFLKESSVLAQALRINKTGINTIIMINNYSNVSYFQWLPKAWKSYTRCSF